MQPGSPITFLGILQKIGDFFVYVKNVIILGTVYAPSGGTSDYASSFAHLFSWIATILTLLFIAFVIWAVYIRIRVYEVDEILDGAYKGHFIKPETVVQHVNPRWQQIEAHFASTNPNDWRAAIIDADAMLEELITKLGYTGDTFGEKLTQIKPNDFPTIQSAWEAHKMRNVIAHEGTAFNLTERQKEITRRYFEAVFRDMGVI